MAWFSNSTRHSDHQDRLKNTDSWTLPTRNSDLAGLGWDLRICPSNKIPSNADAAGLGTTLCDIVI